jgi:hypothetical protein
MGMSGGLFALVPHPQTPPATVLSISGSTILSSGGQWNIGFTVEADVDRLVLPEPVIPERRDELWRTTCFELFLREPATGAYLEFNMSPSGNWAAYAFDGYRQGMRNLEVAPISITSSDPRQFALGMRARLLDIGLSEAEVDAMLAVEEALPEPSPADRYVLSAILDDPALAFPSNFEVAISAVIEELDGTKSYWALAHPPGQPDFHHPACFAGQLAPPSNT